MTKLLIVVAVVSCLEGYVYAGKIQFEKHAANLGNVTQGVEITQRFDFENVGDKTLTIKGVHSSCGCIVQQLPKGNYEPGEKGYIDVSFKTAHYEGPVQKFITVMTNEALNPNRILSLSANVVSDVYLSKPVVDFGTLAINSSFEDRVRIRSHLGNKVKIQQMQYNSNILGVQHTEEGNDAILTIKILPQRKAISVKEKIVVKTENTEVQNVEIVVRASVLGHIQASPRYIEFGAIKKGSEAKRSLVLQSKIPFKINSGSMTILINGDEVKENNNLLSWTAASEKDQVKIDLTLAHAHTAGSVHGKMIFKTSDEDHKEIQVDFYGFFL